MRKYYLYLRFWVVAFAAILLVTGCEKEDTQKKFEDVTIIYLDQAIYNIKADKARQYCDQVNNGDLSALENCEKYALYLKRTPAPAPLDPEDAETLNIECCKCPDPQGECSCTEMDLVYVDPKFRPSIMYQDGTFLEYEEQDFNRQDFKSTKLTFNKLPKATTILWMEVENELFEIVIEHQKIIHIALL